MLTPQVPWGKNELDPDWRRGIRPPARNISNRKPGGGDVVKDFPDV
jgi:hypothetical protein